MLCRKKLLKIEILKEKRILLKPAPLKLKTPRHPAKHHPVLIMDHAALSVPAHDLCGRASLERNSNPRITSKADDVSER